MKSQEYQRTEAERRARALKDLFEPKPYSEEWRTMYYACLFFTPVAQLVSASLALGVPAWISRALFGNWLIGIIAGLIVITIFELMKRNIAATAAKHYYKNELSTKLKLSVAAFMFGSIVMSGFGTPILVKEFAPVPKLASDVDIVGKLDSAHSAQLAHLEQVKADAKRSAAQIHSQNNWKGVTVTAARGNILSLEQQAKAASDSITSLIISHNIDRKNMLYAARVEHEKSMQARNAEIENVGWIFAAICLLFEVLFIFAMFWVFDYKYHQYCELSGTKLSKRSSEKVVNLDASKTVIGFHNEGEILNDGGKMLIYCRKDSGELKAYDASALSSCIRNNKGERKAYFEQMKAKLDTAKR